MVELRVAAAGDANSQRSGRYLLVWIGTHVSAPEGDVQPPAPERIAATTPTRPLARWRRRSRTMFMTTTVPANVAKLAWLWRQHAADHGRAPEQHQISTTDANARNSLPEPLPEPPSSDTTHRPITDLPPLIGPALRFPDQGMADQRQHREDDQECGG